MAFSAALDQLKLEFRVGLRLTTTHGKVFLPKTDAFPEIDGQQNRWFNRRDAGSLDVQSPLEGPF